MASEARPVARRRCSPRRRRRSRAAGIGEPRREALRLWAELSRRAVRLSSARSARRPSSERAAARFREAVRRRAAGEPLAHVTGRTGLPPPDAPERPPRAHPAPGDRRTGRPAPRARAGRAGWPTWAPGSGCIALSLATEGALPQVIGIDLSAEALALARGEPGADRRSRSRSSAAICCPPLGQASLDALVSNPPYLTAAEYAALDASVRDWEPAMALVSGPDGLDAAARLLDEGARPCCGREGGSRWRSIAPGRRTAPGTPARSAGRTSPFMLTFSAASATCSRGGATHRDLGQGAGARPTDRPVDGIPGAAAGGGHAARGQGHRGQAGSDPDAGPPGRPGGRHAVRCPTRPRPRRTRPPSATSRSARSGRPTWSPGRTSRS